MYARADNPVEQILIETEIIIISYYLCSFLWYFKGKHTKNNVQRANGLGNGEYKYPIII